MGLTQFPLLAEGFQTDTQISGAAPGSNGDITMRQLEEWVPPDGSDDDADAVDLGLGTGGENGWSAEDMFRQNRDKYNVGTSYKPTLEGYTVQLKGDPNSEEFR